MKFELVLTYGVNFPTRRRVRRAGRKVDTTVDGSENLLSFDFQPLIRTFLEGS